MFRLTRPARPLPVVPGLVGSIALGALVFDDRVHAAVRRVVPLPERAVMCRVVVGTWALHTVEAAAIYRRARRADLGGAASRWALSTLVWGAVNLPRFRRVTRVG